MCQVWFHHSTFTWGLWLSHSHDCRFPPTLSTCWLGFRFAHSNQPIWHQPFMDFRLWYHMFEQCVIGFFNALLPTSHHTGYVIFPWVRHSLTGLFYLGRVSTLRDGSELFCKHLCVFPLAGESGVTVDSPETEWAGVHLIETCLTVRFIEGWQRHS